MWAEVAFSLDPPELHGLSPGQSLWLLAGAVGVVLVLTVLPYFFTGRARWHQVLLLLLLRLAALGVALLVLARPSFSYEELEGLEPSRLLVLVDASTSMTTPDDFGGQSRMSADGYVESAPEWIGEIAASSVSYDLHDKLNAYRRNGVREYFVWRVLDREVDWFVLREGRYERLALSASSWYQSEVFPGLWLDAAALLRGDLATVLNVAQQGIASPEHAAFVQRLQNARRP